MTNAAMGLILGGIGLLLSNFGGRATAHEPPPTYVALGDSVAVGATLEHPESDGYVALVHEYLEEMLTPGRAGTTPGGHHWQRLTGANLAVSGETTSSMLTGQLPAAVTLISEQNQNNSRRDDVGLITLDIGGNDAFAVVPDCLGGPTPGCQSAVGTALSTFGANLHMILGNLRQAAGPDTEIVMMTYFNPLQDEACYLHTYAGLADEILEGGVFMPTGLNDIIRAIAPVYGVEVAEAGGQLGAEDFSGDCLHPNGNGHAKIAGAFTQAIGD